MFVSTKGSPRQWFEAPLTRGDAGGAWASAFELGGRLSLDDAARLLLVLDPGPSATPSART